MADEIRNVEVQLSEHGTEEVKVTWRSAYPWGRQGYRVPRTMLEKASKDVRARLEALVDEAMRGNVKQSGAVLKELAIAGNTLYRVLFHDRENTAYAESMRQRLMRHDASWQLRAITGLRLLIPWGLVYDGDPDQLSGDPADVDLAHYQSFWCNKYRVASVYPGVNPEGSDMALGLHAIINRAVLARAEQHLHDAGAEAWKWVAEQYKPLIHSQRDWHTRWKSEAANVGILYFYSHADGGNIALNVGDTISAIDLELALTEQRHGVQPPCLIFLNGCSTAVGDNDGNFLEATSNSRFCGFIGAEASVPDVYAMRFGSVFLCELLRGGRSVAEIMFALRQQHWPLSLLYNVYCVPELRMGRPSQPPPPMPTQNFCDLALGTEGV
jgi:hypothetical protein